MNLELPAPGATRLSGHLELVAGPDSRGRTFLRRQSFQAPVHLGKGYEEEGALVLNIVNPTAGLLEGDRLRVDVQVEAGARLVLTMPSASRVHTMRGGRAEVSQEFRVESGGCLEWWPEMLIPQRGACYHQRTRIHLGANSELIFQETLAPGRVASGEAFAYDEIRWKSDVWREEHLLARERFLLTPNNGALSALTRRFPTAYYASIFLTSPLFISESTMPLFGLETDEPAGWIGVTELPGGLIVIKMIASDSLVMRRFLGHCRTVIYRSLRRKAPGLRRAGEPG